MLESSGGLRAGKPTPRVGYRRYAVCISGWLLTLAVATLTSFDLTAALPKTLIYCLEANPSTLRPALAISGTDMNASADQMFNTLTRTHQGGTDLEPSLAESWTVADGGRTYTFKLRKGVEFQTTEMFTPTRNFNADDVLFSFQRQWQPQHPYHDTARGRYTHFGISDLRDTLQSIEKLDDYTVRFRLSEPNVLFPAYMSLPFTAIYSAEYADQLLAAGMPELIDQSPVGTGPFQLTQFQQDQFIRYKAHPRYWEGKAAFDNLVFTITPDTTVRRQKLQAGECHVMAYPNPSDIEALRQDPDIELNAQMNLGVGYLAFNEMKKPLSLRTVRQAINLAIDRQDILDGVYFGVAGRPAKTPVPPLFGRMTIQYGTIPMTPTRRDACWRRLGIRKASRRHCGRCRCTGLIFPTGGGQPK